MTKQQAEEGLALLAAEFEVMRPALLWHGRTRRGRYRHYRRLITLGPKCWRTVENSMLHEFAHHLADVTHGTSCLHDQRFRFALVRVARAWYGDPAKYPWHTEYAVIKKWWDARKPAVLKEGL